VGVKQRVDRWQRCVEGKKGLWWRQDEIAAGPGLILTRNLRYQRKDAGDLSLSAGNNIRYQRLWNLAAHKLWTTDRCGTLDMVKRSRSAWGRRRNDTSGWHKRGRR